MATVFPLFVNPGVGRDRSGRELSKTTYASGNPEAEGESADVSKISAARSARFCLSERWKASIRMLIAWFVDRSSGGRVSKVANASEISPFFKRVSAAVMMLTWEFKGPGPRFARPESPHFADFGNVAEFRV